ncbi:MAG: type II secretion system protein GspM [Gammaproteobacteria bacterium]
MVIRSTTTLHRLLALGLLFTVLASVYVGFLQPLIDAYRSSADRLQQAQAQLAKLIQLAQSRKAIENRLAEFRRTDTSGRYYLSGRTPSLAAAGLQNHLKAIIETSGGQLITSSDLPSTNEEKLTKVATSLRLKAQTEGLREILYATETQLPLVFIDKVSVRGLSFYSPRLTPNTEPMLDIQLDLSGFARVAEAANGKREQGASL